MIFDTLQSAGRYQGIHSRLNAALKLLSGTQLSTLAAGRYDFDAGLFATVSEYTTKPIAETFWEAHYLHADVQIVLDGRERIDWLPRSATAIRKAYDPQRELVELSPRPKTHPVELLLHPGCFAVFFPDDAHRPGIAADHPAPVKKIVFKVRVTDGI
jgi:biofilm protein TabA